MITLNDYLYSGDTLLRILKKYIRDLRAEAKEKHNEIDLVHCNFLIRFRNFWSIMISLQPSLKRSGNFINIWPESIRFLHLHSKAGSNH